MMEVLLNNINKTLYKSHERRVKEKTPLGNSPAERTGRNSKRRAGKLN